MLWVNFIFLLFLGMGKCMIMSLGQLKIKFKPRIKLNYNIYTAKHTQAGCAGPLQMLYTFPATEARLKDAY